MCVCLNFFDDVEVFENKMSLTCFGLDIRNRIHSMKISWVEFNLEEKLNYFLAYRY